MTNFLPIRWKIYEWRCRALILCLLVFVGNSSTSRLDYSMKLQNSEAADQFPQIYDIDVVKEYPHDPEAFTQGLLYAGNDICYESTGLYGRSSIRKVSLQSGQVEDQHSIDNTLFGEGLTVLQDKLYQVMLLQKVGFIYCLHNLTKLSNFTHEMNDGWGLASDGQTLFGSDGSSALYQINPQTMKVIKKHTIKYKDVEVINLNELEYVNGEVWANVWQTDCIARIDPANGTLTGWILLPNLRESLMAAGYTGIGVLNGIAWDSEGQRIFVTGKLWPKLYEIKVVPRKDQSNLNIQELCISKYVDHESLTHMNQPFKPAV